MKSALSVLSPAHPNIQRFLRLASGLAVLLTLLALGIAVRRSGLQSPGPTFLLLDRQSRFLGEVGAVRTASAHQSAQAGDFGYWPVTALPPRVVAATLAVEDRRFFSHPGVDPYSIARAIAQNLRHLRRLSGASTIAMQVARMQVPGGRTYARKALEALTALVLTARHGREALLAHYLTLVPYGNRIHGIHYAARRYLDKPVEDLSWAETAFLAAIPQAPGRMNPFDEGGRRAAIRRGRRILRLLAVNGTLSDGELRLALHQISRIRVPGQAERPDCALHAVLRFEEELRDPYLRKRLAQRPIVKTTLNLDLQHALSQIAADLVKRWAPQGAGNAAILVVDRATHEVVARISSTGYREPETAGAIDYTRVPRSPGSALKPFFFAQALERGTITAATVLDDLDRGAGGITNADDLFLGPLLPRVALANSRNVPAVDLLDRIGLDEGHAFLRDLGLHEGTKPARQYGLGLAIGGLPVTLERLVRAYTVLANDGVVWDLKWHDAQLPKPGRRLLNEETARQLTLFLSDPMARLPSFPRMGPTEFAFPVAVKTGTSSRYRDAWTVAYSLRYLVGVWVGHPDFRPMNRLSGYRSAAELAERVLTALHQGETAGLRDLSFPPPKGFKPHRLCALTGRTATPACDRVFLEWLRPGQEAVDPCAAHVRLAVDKRSGLLATRSTPRSELELRTFVDLGPRYAAWAASAGLPRPPTAVAVGDQVVTVAARTFPMDGAGRAASGHTSTQTGSPFLTAATTSRVKITSPENGTTLLLDPETPSQLATLALRAVSDPPARQLVWYVDGAPFQVVDYPYTARWPLSRGEHVFQARLPNLGTASWPVRVRVP